MVVNAVTRVVNLPLPYMKIYSKIFHNTDSKQEQTPIGSVVESNSDLQRDF